LVVVEASGNGGQFIAANSGKIVFNETKDNQNAWSNNNLFTAPKDGYYLVNGSVFTTAVTSARIESYIDNIKSNQPYSVLEDVFVPLDWIIGGQEMAGQGRDLGDGVIFRKRKPKTSSCNGKVDCNLIDL